ncbi:TetR family transcriptional regulator, partial [Yersinia pestis]
MQREQVLSNALNLLEQQGLANTTLEMLAKALSVEVSDLTRFW